MLSLVLVRYNNLLINLLYEERSKKGEPTKADSFVVGLKGVATGFEAKELSSYKSSEVYFL